MYFKIITQRRRVSIRRMSPRLWRLFYHRRKRKSHYPARKIWRQSYLYSYVKRQQTRLFGRNTFGIRRQFETQTNDGYTTRYDASSIRGRHTECAYAYTVVYCDASPWGNQRQRDLYVYQSR